MTITILLLGLLQLQAFVASAEPIPNSNPIPSICALSNIHSLFGRYPDSAPRFCTSYLHYPTTTRTVTTTIKVTAPAKTISKFGYKCTTSATFTFDTDYVADLPATTLTEFDTTYTVVVLTFGGSFIDVGGFKRAIPTAPPIPKRNDPSPLTALTTCKGSVLSQERSSIAHHPTTRTIVKHTSIKPTTTITVSECTNQDYDFEIYTTSVPSQTFFKSGYKTVTLEVTTETAPYYCYSYRVGCVTQVPTPCCPGTCTDIGLGYPVCAPTDASLRSSMFGLTSTAP